VKRGAVVVSSFVVVLSVQERLKKFCSVCVSVAVSNKGTCCERAKRRASNSVGV